MRIAVIGGGPAGSRAAAVLARQGHEVHLFDRSLDREKPCGGGVPWAGLGALAPFVAESSVADGFEPDRLPACAGGPRLPAPELPPPALDGRSAAGLGPVGAREDDSSESTHSGVLDPPRTRLRPPSERRLGDVPTAEIGAAPPFAVPCVAVRRIVFEGPSGRTAELALDNPVAVFSRRSLDRALLEEARVSGAILAEEPVTALEPEARGFGVALRGKSFVSFDHVVGADGARSFVRARVASSFSASDFSQAVGWYVPAGNTDTMTIRFDPRIRGYLWVFPRLDHLAVGACAPLEPGATEALWKAAADLLESRGLGEKGSTRYSALIPTLGPAALAANRLSGPSWSLVGDASGTVDPLTREGIRHAIHGADLLGEAFAAGEPESYAARWRREFLAEFVWAAEHRDRFFAPHMTERLVRYLSGSRVVRRVAADVIQGAQDYRSLKRRLIRTALPAGLELGIASVRSRFARRA